MVVWEIGGFYLMILIFKGLLQTSTIKIIKEKSPTKYLLMKSLDKFEAKKQHKLYYKTL